MTRSAAAWTARTRVVESSNTMQPAATAVKQGSSHGSADSLAVLTPRVCQLAATGWVEAQKLAQSQNEPVFVPVTPYADDRGWSLMNLLNGVMTPEGQINYSVQYPGVVKAWHRHDKQTDFWVCLSGHLKVGVYRERDNTAWMAVMGQMQPGILIIPPPLWHGAACIGPEPSALLYYVTHAYDQNQPDEHRRAWDSVKGFPWAPRNG